MSTLALSSIFWSLAALLDSERVTAWAWTWLYVACLSCAAAVWHVDWLRRSPAVWLCVAAYAALLAGILWGANQGLDALHGATRAKANVAAGMGGLELWFVLVPGVLSVALANCLHAALARGTGMHRGLARESGSLQSK